MSRARNIPQDLDATLQSAASRGARKGRQEPGLVGAAPDVEPPATRAESGAGPSLLDELLTATEVAAILRLRVSTVEDYARRGVLPSVKVGRHRRFVRSQLERAIAARLESA